MSSLSLIPQPRRVRARKGSYTLPERPLTHAPRTWTRLALHLTELFAGQKPTLSTSTTHLRIRCDRSLPSQGYELRISRRGILILAHSEQSAFYALCTLVQLQDAAEQHTFPCLTIIDHPDIPTRGIYLDVTRGRVPTIKSLKNTIRLLALHKINHIQLYIEHVFKFAHHPTIGSRSAPLSPADIQELDHWCRLHYIEFTPSLASFGHMAPILSRPEYRHMAEDLGRGIYERPGAIHAPYRKGWTLSPAHPESYDFIQSLYDDFLPHFTSKQFNVCCDETYDLGDGQSYAMCESTGRGKVYMDHVLKLRKAAARHKKKIMFWSDVIRQYPDQLPRIPKNATLLDWGYEHNTPYQRIKTFIDKGHTVWACPGTSSWVTLFPRIHEARANILGYARAAKRHDAPGLLVTDWGDGGHYNFTEFSWHGLLFGAEAGWNSKHHASFDRRFCQNIIGTESTDFLRALCQLGDISHTQFGPYYQSIWKHLFFESPDHEIFQNPKDLAWTASNGVIDKEAIRLSPAFGRKTSRQLKKIRATFLQTNNSARDKHGLLPYWIYAIDTLLFAAEKLIVFGGGRTVSKKEKRTLAIQLQNIATQFEELWMKRNQRSEIRITLKRLKDQLRELESAQ